MRKILYSAVALVLACTSMFGQDRWVLAKNAKDYYIGSIISGKAYAEDGVTKPLGTMKFNPWVSTSIPNVLPVQIKPTLGDLQAFVAKATTGNSLGAGGSNFSSLVRLSDTAAVLDEYLDIKDAAKVFFPLKQGLKGYSVYVTQSSSRWFDVIADVPEEATDVYLTADEEAKWKAENPLVVAAVGYGRRVALLIASKKPEHVVKDAYAVFKGKKTQEYAKANAVLADAFITVVAYGKKHLDTTGMSAQEVFEAYHQFVERPIEQEELLTPLYFFPTSAIME